MRGGGYETNDSPLGGGGCETKIFERLQDKNR